MASAFAHAAAGAALGAAFWRPGFPRRVLVAAAACAVLPDLDVLAFRFGIPYEHVLGHRGITHSVAFSAGFAALLVALFFRGGAPGVGAGRLWLLLALATLSHAVLDAMTDGGLGVAFLAPFENGRYFLPFRPIEVSPLGVRRFFTARGVEVVASELLWVGLPSLLFAVAARAVRGPAPAAADPSPRRPR